MFLCLRPELECQFRKLSILIAHKVYCILCLKMKSMSIAAFACSWKMMCRVSSFFTTFLYAELLIDHGCIIGRPAQFQSWWKSQELWLQPQEQRQKLRQWLCFARIARILKWWLVGQGLVEQLCQGVVITSHRCYFHTIVFCSMTFFWSVTSSDIWSCGLVLASLERRHVH